MNQENRIQRRHSSAVAALKRLPESLDDEGAARTAELKAAITKTKPLIAHFDNDKAQAAAWRKDKNRFWTWLCHLISSTQSLRSLQNAQQEQVSISGVELGEINRRNPGSCGPKALIFIKENKFGFVDKAGALYINLVKLPPGVLSKARIARDRALAARKQKK